MAGILRNAPSIKITVPGPPDAARIRMAAENGRRHAALAPNDSISNPTIVTSVPFFLTYDIGSTTAIASDPTRSCAPGQGANTVWFRYTADFSGDLRISTVGSTYDTVLTIYPGIARPGPEYTCNDDAFFALVSQLTIQVSVGQTYFIEVSRYGGTPGLGDLTIAFTKVQRRAHKAGFFRNASALWIQDTDGNGNYDGNLIDVVTTFGTGSGRRSSGCGRLDRQWTCEDRSVPRW